MSTPPLSLSPFQFTNPINQASTQIPILSDPISQLSDEFGLQDINDVQTRLFEKTNGLRNEHDRQMVHNHVRAFARQLLLKLQNLRDLHATAHQLQQTGLETLRELESSSIKMIQDFERFQAGSRELEHRYSEFDAKLAVPANSLTWAAFSDTSVQSSSASPLMGAIGQYSVRPSADQPSVIASVVQKVNRLANVKSSETQEANRKNERSTTLAKSSHASPAHVDMETKKTQIAQCVRMEDSEAPGSTALCIAYHLKGLSETQQRALLDFVPKAYVGQGANSAAAPFAAVSMAAKAVTKAIFQVAVTQSCSEQHPGDLHGFNQCRREQNDIFAGRNPKFNQTIAAETPKIVKKAVAFIASVDSKLVALDLHMYEQYRTIPGIIHEGCYGAVDTALMIPGLRLAKGAASSAASVFKTSLRLSPEIAPQPSIARWLVETGKLQKNQFLPSTREQLLIVPRMKYPLVSVSDPMGLCFYRMNKHLEELALTSNSQKHSFGMFLEEHAETLAQYIPKLDMKTFLRTAVKKETVLHKNNYDTISRINTRTSQYIVLQSDPQKIVGSYFGLNYVRQLKLKNADFPTPIAIGVDNGEYWLMMLDMGESLLSLMKRNSNNIQTYFNQAGLAYGELHSKYAIKVNPGHPLHNKFLFFAETNEGPLAKYPISVGLTQGDAHLGNITWNKKSGKMAFIDLEFFINNLSIDKRPCEFPILEYSRILGDIATTGKELGMPQSEIVSLTEAFKRGYKATNPGAHPLVEKIVMKLEYNKEF